MVSIKNIPAGGSDKVLLFILISIAVHALTLILLSNSPGALSWLLGPESGRFERERPLTVELKDLRSKEEKEEDRTVEIVDVPEDPSSSPPEEIVRYAGSSRSAEVEEFPEKTVPSGERALFPSPERNVPIITKAVPLKDKPGDEGEGRSGKALKEDKAAESKAAASKDKSPPAAKKAGVREPLKVNQLTGVKESLEDIALLNGNIPYPTPHEKALGKASGATGATSDTQKKSVAPRESPGTGAGKSPKREARPGGVVLMPSPGRLAQITKDTETYEGHVPPDARRGKTLLLNTTEFKYQEYFMHIKRKIEFYWEYPPVAARQGQQGRLKISFVIRKDGTVKVDDIELAKGSNYSMLDDAAVTAIRLASPFNPFPKGFEADDITIKGSFEYSLYGYPGAGR